MLAKRYLISILLYLICFNNYAQVNKKGISYVKNYTKEDYNASEQNWAVCQDNRGVMYFGNNDEGILVFNGNTWEKIFVYNNEVRSLAADNVGTIYVGGNNEFGYLLPNTQGKLIYNSLVSEVNDTMDIGKIWKVYCKGDETFFCSFLNIYHFKNKKYLRTYHYGKGGFFSFLIQDKLYWGNYYEGLLVESADTFKQIKGGDYYKNKDIFTILPFSDNELFIGTMVQGCFIYNLETGRSENIETINDNFKRLSQNLINSQLYKGFVLSDSNFAFATLNDGLLIVNRNGEIIERYYKENRLPESSVADIYEDNFGGIWLVTVNGISYIEYYSPYKKFDSKDGLDGIILNVKTFKNNLYVATTSGLYYQKFDTNGMPYFKLVPGMDQFVWNMLIIKIDNQEKLIVATSRNTYELLSPQHYKAINSNEYTNCHFLHQSKNNPNKIYIGFETGINYVEYKNGEWTYKERFKQTKEDVKSIYEDIDGNVWIGGSINGIAKIINDSIIIRYNLEHGLPSLEYNSIYGVGDKIIIATKEGLYEYEEETERFKKYHDFGESFSIKRDYISEIFSFKENEYWIISKSNETGLEYIEKITISQDRLAIIKDIPFKRLVKSKFYDISPADDGNIWIATSDAIYYYYENVKIDNNTNYFNCIINKVSIGIDSIIFWGTNYTDTINKIIALEQPRELKQTVNYKHNSFQFNYSSPFFPTDELVYSSILQGFDEEWTNWDIKTERNFTNLDQGHYTFKVKAKNIYGIESEIAAYEFTIKPPWYETLLAYFCYVIISIFIIIVIVKVYTRRLELEKIRLEQIVKERTEEVVKQKEEIEKQRDEIAEKNKSITDSIEYAKRIQTAVLPSNDFAKEVLPEHFILFRPRDIVSGDFYWFTKKDNLLVIIAADCTGHGVPGAFMSMLGVSFLNEIVNRHDVTTAGAILTQLRADVKKTLGQEGKEGEAKDGMDIALCIVDFENLKMQYAGAYNPLYLCRNNELIEVKADRMPIGIYIKEKESFTNNEIDLENGDTFYLFSDGYADQFGGEDGQKFKSKNFKELLLEIHHKPMAEQREILNTTIDKWRGRWEQVDDIIILGIRV